MLCDICKNKKANVHLTEIINDEVTELHLCDKCAKAKGTEMQQHFSIADLLSGLVDLPSDNLERKQHVRVKCESCGMNYSDFKKLGRFGCSKCYEAFKRALYPLFKSIHSSTRHTGKHPRKLVLKGAKPEQAQVEKRLPKDDIEEFKIHLAKAIKNEEFEEAAALRDRIRALENK
ncbi:MAG: UvrB/UvrC motif-containing protein [Candidatus Omnitrophota bacterium]